MTLAARLRSFAAVYGAVAVAFLFVAAGALATYRVIGLALAFPFGVLVGLAERPQLPFAPRRFALRSGAAFVAWFAASGIVVGLLVPRLANLGRWGPLLLLAFVAGLAGALVSAAVETQRPLGTRFFVTMVVARVASAVVAVLVFRTGLLYAGIFAAAAAYALVFSYGVASSTSSTGTSSATR